jgi:hypothetical protein
LTCLRSLELDAVEEEVDLLVVESDEPGEGEHLAGGEVVGPGNVGMRATVDDR